MESLRYYLNNDPAMQAILFSEAMEIDNKEYGTLAQGIILHQNIALSYGPHENTDRRAKEIMTAILNELQGVEKPRVPFRVIFALGSVAYSHCEIEVRKAAADLLVRWAVPTPPPRNTQTTAATNVTTHAD